MDRCKQEDEQGLTVNFIDYDSLSLEDFHTTRPFEYLYSLSHDKFLQTSELNKIVAAGKRAGVRNVMQLWKAYLTSINRQTVHVDSFTEFQDQPLELNAGNWVASEDGIYRSTEHNVEYACKHPIMPIERICNVDNGTEKVNLAFKRGRGGTWRTMLVSKDDIASHQKIISLNKCGVSVTSENAKALVKYLQDIEDRNYDRIPSQDSAGRMGWINDSTFLPYDCGKIVFDGKENFRTQFNAIQAHGSLAIWQQHVNKLRRGSVFARIALAASFASPLLALIDASCMFVHLWSSMAGTGKTVLAMLASSVWGNPEIGKYTQTFNATEVAAEWLAEFYNSLPLVMDEFQLAQGKNFNVYKIAQGTGKARGMKSGGIDRTPTWRLVCITTGETPLTSALDGAGALARVIDIEIDRVVLDLTRGQETVKIIKQHHGVAAPEYVKLLKTLGREAINERYSQIVKELMRSDTIHDKQAMSAAALLLADEYADASIFQDELGALTLEDLLPFLQNKTDTSIGVRAYELLEDWIAANNNRFDANCTMGRYGKIDEADLYTEKTAYIINSTFNDLMSTNGLSPRAVLSALKKLNLINCEIEKNGKINHYVRVRIDGVSCRCVALKLKDDGQGDDDAGACEAMLL